MFCPLCGSELRANAKFCGKCGASIAAAPIIAAPPAAPAPAEETPAVSMTQAVSPNAEAAAENTSAVETAVEKAVAPAPVPAPPAVPAFYAPAPQSFQAPAAPAQPAEVPAAPASYYTPAPAVPFPASYAEPAAPTVPVAPISAEAVKAKTKGGSWRILQIILLVTSAAAVVFMFLGIFGYTAGAYSNRFSLFGLCMSFAGSEICMAGQPVFAELPFLTWNLLFYIVGGIALVGLLFVLLATLLKKAKLNITAIVSNLILAGFAVFTFFAFRNALVSFLTDYVTINRLASLSASADLTECGFVLAALCALNVVLAVVLSVFGGTKKKRLETVNEIPML